ncbi:hypothetical protein J2X01_002947 [Arthrobacter ginsengisoli]|uniref:Uncharacterized protein n=1 Tax=Arthrobacter ginsengisoli TaxID=1356565 RepID=A0ABU1UEN4_9MICC|nr:hypothetical protein [Arthrobacter ginsengisoli]MDR7083652.1 hypothetical protein [Arthrobacter ginsengisoli]
MGLRGHTDERTAAVLGVDVPLDQPRVPELLDPLGGAGAGDEEFGRELGWSHRPACTGQQRQHVELGPGDAVLGQQGVAAQLDNLCDPVDPGDNVDRAYLQAGENLLPLLPHAVGITPIDDKTMEAVPTEGAASA